jgi:hypothetical protein
MRIEIELYQAAVLHQDALARVRIVRELDDEAQAAQVTIRDHDSGADLAPTHVEHVYVGPDGRIYGLGKRIG